MVLPQLGESIQGTDGILALGINHTLYAFAMALLSGLSLPIGAFLGILTSPVSDRLCAAVLAFGAGSLTFAVCVEIYAEGIHQYADSEINTCQALSTVLGGVIGAWFFLHIDKALSEHGTHGTAQAETTPVDSESNKQAPEETGKEPNEDSNEALSEAEALLGKIQPRSIGLRADSLANLKKVEQGKAVAYSLFLGLLIDGIPEGIFLGFLSAQGHLCIPLIVSLFIANFPEAFSSASLLINAKVSKWTIMGMWTGLCLLVACLAGASCSILLNLYPAYERGAKLPNLAGTIVNCINGFTGGAMLACIMKVMIPESSIRLGKHADPLLSTGFLCASGFLFSVVLSIMFPSFNYRHAHWHGHSYGHAYH